MNYYQQHIKHIPAGNLHDWLLAAEDTPTFTPTRAAEFRPATPEGHNLACTFLTGPDTLCNRQPALPISYRGGTWAGDAACTEHLLLIEGERADGIESTGTPSEEEPGSPLAG